MNPVMMQPKTVGLYVSDIDDVAQDFVELTKKSLDAKQETPADYGTYLQRFAMEAIATVALETRLNVLDPSGQNKGAELAKLTDDVFYLTYQLDILPSIWKFYKTPTFHKLMKTLDQQLE